ncbi:FeoB-associated Cys-rich membrane protein [Desulfobacter latus]|uniref:FeoB-associated Cys-rich membrane protein n=1 Tax=Desulfobacter latus TaxID=2292 RepID=A0A850SXG8_9BACT|nr:FeoB-associated Cys-rich membrane protein [Desulfobacter latus]NWH05839.1 FeoB-associated Cys-rich membrane protein [Desulfobacter latus]
MGNILVGLIVAAALFYCIKRVINAFKGKSPCSCACEDCTPDLQKNCTSRKDDSDVDRLDKK